MGLGSFLFGSNDTTQNPGDLSSYAGQAPSAPISVTSSGKNSNINPTVNIVPTSNVDASENSGLVLSNANTGNISIVSSDGGAIMGAFDFANSRDDAAYNFAAGAGASAFKLVDNYRKDSADFNTALIGEFGDLSTYTHQAYIEGLGALSDQSAGVISGLGGLLRDTLTNQGNAQGDALDFVGQQVGQLQNATVAAINTVGLRNQSEGAQAFDKLQDTLVKLGAGAAVVLIIAVVLIKKVK